MEWVFPLTTLMVSLFTMVFTGIQYRQLTQKTLVKDLQEELKQCEIDLRNCERVCDSLRRENNDLLRQLAKRT